MLEKAGLYDVSYCIEVRRQTILNFIVNRPIFQLCKDAVRLRGTSPRQYWWDQAIDWDLAEDAAECRATRIALCRAAAIAAQEEPGPGPPNNTAPPGAAREPIMGTGVYINPFAAPATTTAAEGGRVITPLQRDIAPIPDAAEAEGGPPRTMIGHRCPVSRGG